MDKIVVTGKTVEAAVKRGLAEWNVTEDRVNVNVLEQPSKRLFGLFGAKEAIVELERISDPVARPIDPVDETIRFVQDVLQAMQLDAAVEQKRDREGVSLNITGPELGMVIGRRGQTLDALQYLANIVANRHADSFVRVALDAEQFRERRKKTLEQLSERLAERVVRTKKEVVLEPMPPQERKVIHAHLQHHPVVKTYSKGEEPNRRVVIVIK